jgi:hypothetical protein
MKINLGEIGSRMILKKQIYQLIKQHPGCTADNLHVWCFKFLDEHDLGTQEIDFILEQMIEANTITEVREPTYSIAE